MTQNLSYGKDLAFQADTVTETIAEKTLNGNQTINGTLTVANNTALNGDVVVGGNQSNTGHLTVLGDNYLTNTIGVASNQQFAPCSGPWSLSSSNFQLNCITLNDMLFWTLKSNPNTQTCTATTNTLTITGLFTGFNPNINFSFPWKVVVNGTITDATVTVFSASGDMQIVLNAGTWTNTLTGALPYYMSGNFAY